MSRRPTRTPTINGKSQRGPKSGQRARLIDAVVAVANRDGYAGANVAALAAEAGVSKPTFYDYFADKDDCFVAALADVHAELLGELRSTVGDSPQEDATNVAIATLVGFAASQPARARFLMTEAMAGGSRALDARDEGIARIAELIDNVHEPAADDTAIADISSRVLIGGVYRLLAARLRRGEPGIARLLEDVLAWAESYRAPSREHRWDSRDRSSSHRDSPSRSEPPLRAPIALGRGRPRISEEEVAQTHRQRILFAAAALAEQKGYSATTVADIVKLAHVDRRAFYSLFSDKQQAFMAVHEFGLQEVLAVTAGGFFTGPNWPERIWEAGRALTDFLQANPTIAHVGFVDAYAVGPGAAQRVEDSHAAFSIFLQEGYAYARQSASPSRVALEAIITGVFELVYIQAREAAQPRISGLLAQMAFLVLAPFLGASEAQAFIDQKSAGDHSDSHKTKRTGKPHS
jgi:AcrR family transcriptional regulator